LIILDTGGLYAYLDYDDAEHGRVRGVVDADPGPFILSPFVLAEADYLVQTRMGVDKECLLLDQVDAGVYTLVTFGDEDVAQAAGLVRQYADLGIGLTDASVAVVAARYRTVDLLSLDQRHFRAMRPLRGGDAFRLLPSDAS
jgi:predicted nucleic acid-binding protein